MRSGILLVAVGLGCLAAPPKKDLTPQEAEEVIQKFAARESDFAKARENYTYRQSVKIQVVDRYGVAKEKMEIVSDVIFNADGKRTERVIYAPVSTIVSIQITPQDEQDLRSVQPFVLTSKDIVDYYVRYLGWEQLDEVGCYSFAVKPKKMVEGKRYFEGVVWVDDRDLQIVKSYGRGVGLEKNKGDHKYPKFETYREQIDGKYWFPTYTIANDILPFDSGPIPIRMQVTYKDYKQFKSESTITFGGEADAPKAPPKKQ